MKKNTFNLTLLTGIFCLGLITSNLFGGKLISVLGLTVAGAIVTVKYGERKRRTIALK